MAKPFRFLQIVCMTIGLVAVPAAAQSRGATTRAEVWAAAVVNKIAQADLKVSAEDRRGGTVTVRLRILADGTLDGAAVESGSGSATVDERAMRAVRAAAPFAPPPRTIVTLEGFTEISFALDFDTAQQ